MELKSVIFRQVQLNNGISITKMILNAMAIVGPTKHTPLDYNLAINDLTLAGEIFQLKFTDPESPTGAKAILFLQGTKFLNLSEIVDVETTSTSQTKLAGKSSSDI